MAELLERRLYLDGPFGQIHVREAAPAAVPKQPPLVCFHQSPISGAQYALFQRVMAADRRVLCPDTPGFGSSDPPNFVPEITDYASALALVLERETTPCDVLGFHTGTLIAVELAASRPRLVRRLVLSSLALFTAEERATNKATFGGPRPLFTNPDYVERYYDAQVTQGLPGISEERRLELFTERLRSGLLSWYGPEAVFAYDTQARIQAVEQPTLLLALQDTLSENTLRAARFMANPTVQERLDIQGPAGWDAQPEAIAAEVRAFLDDTDSP